MTFSVNGIKQEKNDKYKVEMLVCVDAPLLARKILEEKNILILSLKEFSQEKKTFGDVYFTIQLNFQETEIVTKHKDIQEAAKTFSLMGFDIATINSYSTPISTEEMSIIIADAKAEAEAKKTKVKEQIKKIEAQEKKVYEDANLKAAKKIIFRVFEKIEETTKRSSGAIAIQDMKKIKVLSEELRKLRMGTNFEKIRETIQELFMMIEKINDEWYVSIQNPDDIITPNSLVTKVDLDRELDRMENVKILKMFHINIAAKNQDYAILGSYGIFWNFLQKDFLYKIANLWSLLYNFYDIAELLLVVIATLLGIYTLANEVLLFSTSQYGFAFSMITIGIRWCVLFIVRKLRNKTISRLILLAAVAIVLHYVVMRVVTNNFAL